MSRFKQKHRDRIPGNIVNHFDKYIQYTNPVEFDVLNDVYRPAWTGDEWRAIQTLEDSKYKNDTLRCRGSFKLMLSGDDTQRDWERDYVTFNFKKGTSLPEIKISYDDVSPMTKVAIEKWLSKAKALRKMRREFYNRCKAMLDWGWDAARTYDSYNSCWRGGPTSRQGCNTIGQVDRLWPELLAFFPMDQVAKVRNASVRSRLPAYIADYGTPEQFMCTKRPDHRYEYDEDTHTVTGYEPFTDEEWDYEKRKLEAINTIITQMSLIKDVHHVEDYPDIHLRG